MASMTAEDVLAPVRELLNDEKAEFFWTEPWLRARLNAGIRILRAKRPEARLDDTTGDPVTFAAAATPTAVLCVSDHWKDHLVEYVLWQSFSRDRKDGGHQTRASAHKANWDAMLLT